MVSYADLPSQLSIFTCHITPSSLPHDIPYLTINSHKMKWPGFVVIYWKPEHIYQDVYNGLLYSTYLDWDNADEGRVRVEKAEKKSKQNSFQRWSFMLHYIIQSCNHTLCRGQRFKCRSVSGCMKTKGGRLPKGCKHALIPQPQYHCH